MDSCKIVFYILLTVLGVYLIINQQNEKFNNLNLNYGPFKPLNSNHNLNSRLVDPMACHRGTYWRNKAYDAICKPLNKNRPERMSVEGEKRREPQLKYQMVCNRNLNNNNNNTDTNCKLVKVYNKYY